MTLTLFPQQQMVASGQIGNIVVNTDRTAQEDWAIYVRNWFNNEYPPKPISPQWWMEYLAEKRGADYVGQLERVVDFIQKITDRSF